MDNNELNKRFGTKFCQVFGYEFVRTHLRVDISPKELDQEIVAQVAKQTNPRLVLLSSNFWIELTDLLDSKYTFKRTNIKFNITWRSISGRFLKDILPRIGDFNLPENFIINILQTIDAIFSEKDFTSVNDLLNFQIEESLNDLFENDECQYNEEIEDIISKSTHNDNIATHETCDNQERVELTDNINVEIKSNEFTNKCDIPTTVLTSSDENLQSKELNQKSTDDGNIQCDMISSNEEEKFLLPISSNSEQQELAELASSNKIELINEAYDIDVIEESPLDELANNKNKESREEYIKEFSVKESKEVNALNQEFESIITDAIVSLTDSVKEGLIDLTTTTTTKVSKTVPEVGDDINKSLNLPDVNEIEESPLEVPIVSEKVIVETKNITKLPIDYNFNPPSKPLERNLNITDKKTNTSGEIIDLSCNNNKVFFQDIVSDDSKPTTQAVADENNQKASNNLMMIEYDDQSEFSLVIDIERNDKEDNIVKDTVVESAEAEHANIEQVDLTPDMVPDAEPDDLHKPGPSKTRKRSVYFINDKKLKKFQRQGSVERRREFVKKVTTQPNFDDTFGDQKYFQTVAKRKKIKLRSAAQNYNSQSDSDDDWLTVPDNNRSLDESVDDDNVSNRSTLSFVSRVNYQKIFIDNKAKHAYTSDEDQNILKYITKSGRYSEIKGNQLWKDMAEKNICVNRSWQSMKERFRKTIGPNLTLYAEMYNISEQEMEYLQSNTYLVPKQNNNNEEDDNVSRRSDKVKRLPAKAASPPPAPSKPISKAIMGNSYTLEEDEEIVSFIFKLQQNEAIRGRSIWIRLSKEFERNTNRSRTWQSLRERFIKRIAPKIYSYQNANCYDRAIKIVEGCLPSLNEQNRIKEILKNRFDRKKRPTRKLTK